MHVAGLDAQMTQKRNHTNPTTYTQSLIYNSNYLFIEIVLHSAKNDPLCYLISPQASLIYKALWLLF